MDSEFTNCFRWIDASALLYGSLFRIKRVDAPILPKENLGKVYQTKQTPYLLRNINPLDLLLTSDLFLWFLTTGIDLFKACYKEDSSTTALWAVVLGPWAREHVLFLRTQITGACSSCMKFLLPYHIGGEFYEAVSANNIRRRKAFPKWVQCEEAFVFVDFCNKTLCNNCLKQYSFAFHLSFSVFVFPAQNIEWMSWYQAHTHTHTHVHTWRLN